jgi:hypothetical protein
MCFVIVPLRRTALGLHSAIRADLRLERSAPGPCFAGLQELWRLGSRVTVPLKGLATETTELPKERALAHAYRCIEDNLRFEENPRASIAPAEGHYCVLYGEYDCLGDTHAEPVNYATRMVDQPRLLSIGGHGQWTTSSTASAVGSLFCLSEGC